MGSCVQTGEYNGSFALWSREFGFKFQVEEEPAGLEEHVLSCHSTQIVER